MLKMLRWFVGRCEKKASYSGSWRKQTARFKQENHKVSSTEAAMKETSSKASKPPAANEKLVVSSARRTETLRLKKQNGKDIEMDTTVARIIGSDWGDRSNQPVSFAMRFYWIIFAVIIGNGIYTSLTGKDERHIYDKLVKKWNKMLGRVETNEFVTMADTKENDRRGHSNENEQAGNSHSGMDFEEPIAEASIVVPTPSSGSVRSLVLGAKQPIAPIFGVPSMMTGFGNSSPTKEQLLQQLQALRSKQEQLVQEKRLGTNWRHFDSLQKEIEVIDEQKKQLKIRIKQMKA